MNAPIRRVAVAVAILVLALLVNANVVQVGEAGSLRKNPHNVRVLIGEYSRERGPIVVDGQAVAKSIKTNDTLKYERVYSNGPLFAPVTGYYSLVYGAVGMEHAENDILSGTDSRLFVRRLSDIIAGRQPRGGAVVLTINQKAQQAAWQGLAGRKGAVVALDPRTGAILALVSAPSYDPSKLSTHDTKAIQSYYRQESPPNNPNDPMLDRAISQTYPPGSLFKIVTASTALGHGYRPDTVIPAPHTLPLPQTTIQLKNFGNEVCDPSNKQPLIDAFTISCNTAFGDLGMTLGASALRDQAAKFGIDGSRWSMPLQVEGSHFPSHPDTPETALSSIGQYNVRLTPMQAAMLAAAIANGGVLMKPYLVKEIQAPDLSTIDTAKPQEMSRAVSPQVASEMTQLMLQVVNNPRGTGTAAQIPGVPVAGKTGTAQHGTGLPPHAWFVCFAPADHPQVAVAVIVESGGGMGSDATGGTVAAPIAKAVVQAVLGK